MQSLELLAPAKNLKCGIAAIDHGADAVYIGPPKFGARAAAANSVEDIATLCSYAHQFMAKVYVTLNTIVFDHELEDTRQMIDQLSAAGVDALLIQDMALTSEKEKITLHASTQTDNRTAEKVKWLRSQGFNRVVLARELTIEEIHNIHEAVPDIELEVFVHGALCVSYSGQCYASYHCFGRSANRGQCAQFCRMQFDLIDGNGQELIHQRHLLSLKDLNQSKNLESLIQAGATAFKIEGRLKDIDYVKNVTAAYSQLLNNIIARHPQQYRRASLGHCQYTFKPNLQKTFNRGYTTYFAHGRQPHIASFDTPKATGEPVGTVANIGRDHITVDGDTQFANGDGLCFFNDSRQLEGFRVNRADGHRLHLQQVPRNLRTGMPLFRNSDMLFNQLLARPSAVRKIPVTMSLRETPDGFLLSAILHPIGQTLTLPFAFEKQKAEKPQRDNIIRQLTKLGNTPYECTSVDIDPDFPYFLPASLLADIRRQLLSTATLKAPSNIPPLGEAHEASPAALKASPTALKTSPHWGRLEGTPYLYNAANHESQEFYRRQGIAPTDALELHQPGHYTTTPDSGNPGSLLLMQCRYCLRHALGHCTRHRQQPDIAEPLSLRLSDGRTFNLSFDCKHCQMNILKKLYITVAVVIATLLGTACTNNDGQTPDKWYEVGADTTLSRLTTSPQNPYYYPNDNFIVKADSLHIIEQLPAEAVSDMPVDTLTLRHNDRIVVADIIILQTDSIDSVWVRLARDEYTIGWTRESTLLPAVKPADTISQCIDFFASTHLAVFLILIAGVVALYSLHPKTPLVHFRDIHSVYPTLLTLLVAATATLYSSIQTHDADTWRHFYYHPTLNPIDAPVHLRLFLLGCWAIIIVAIAAIDDTRRQLPTATAVYCLLGLAATSALCYIVFNVTTRYYIGYPLLIVYGWWAIRRYLHHSHAPYRCGHCGQPMQRKGHCPKCGALNT